MPRKGQSLAARLRATMNAEVEAERRAEKAREERLAKQRAARASLFIDLVEFAEAVGHFVLERSATQLTIRREERWLTFEPIGDAGVVKVTFEGSGDAHRLYQEAQLLDKWAWRFPRHGREERLLFWDSGLEELLALALEVRPTEGIAPADLPDGEDDGATTLTPDLGGRSL